MNAFGLIFATNFKRMARDWQVWLLVAIPFAFIALNLFMNEEIIMNGYDVIASLLAPVFMLSFQFFGTGVLAAFLADDFSSAVRWRLQALPISQRVFFFATATATWLFSVLQGVLIIVGTSLFFNAYWGNLWVTLGTLAIVALMVQLISITLFGFLKKKGQADTASYIIGFGLMAMAGTLGIHLGDGVQRYNPVGLAVSAIQNAGFMGTELGENALNSMVISGSTSDSLWLLLAMTAVFGVLAFISGRKAVR